MHTFSTMSLRQKALTVAMVLALLFIILTGVAMLFYPGGTAFDPTTEGYQFANNYFSTLGLTRAHNGQPNWISAILFFSALSLAGVGLIIFFVTMPGLFVSGLQKYLTRLGSFLGVGAGLCFMGVAFSPGNLLPQAHRFFVLSAFSLFMLAAVLYAVALYAAPGHPRVYTAVFAVFALLLVGYVYLIVSGPAPDTYARNQIHVLAQKGIAYAAIITTLIEAYGAWALDDRLQTVPVVETVESAVG